LVGSIPYLVPTQFQESSFPHNLSKNTGSVMTLYAISQFISQESESKKQYFISPNSERNVPRKKCMALYRLIVYCKRNKVRQLKRNVQFLATQKRKCREKK
jgi:hypothetical protein